MKRSQLVIFGVLLITYTLTAFLTYGFFSQDLADLASVPLPDLGVSNIVLGLANGAIALVLYGALGLAGYWFALRLGLPGIYREESNWRDWFATPLIFGVLCGVALILGDLVFASHNGIGPFPHPTFPFSVVASLAAGIGEEIVFRGFVFGFWATILSWLLRSFGRPQIALWSANLIAALVFGAGHLGMALTVTGAETLGDLNPILLVEIFLLNGIVGIVAGERYIKHGLIAAAGVHFWTDIVWHVVWGLIR